MGHGIKKTLHQPIDLLFIHNFSNKCVKQTLYRIDLNLSLLNINLEIF